MELSAPQSIPHRRPSPALPSHNRHTSRDEENLTHPSSHPNTYALKPYPSATNPTPSNPNDFERPTKKRSLAERWARLPRTTKIIYILVLILTIALVIGIVVGLVVRSEKRNASSGDGVDSGNGSPEYICPDIGAECNSDADCFDGKCIDAQCWCATTPRDRLGRVMGVRMVGLMV